MVTTADLDNDIESLRTEVSDLRSEVAEVRGQLGMLLALARYGGAIVGVLLLVQTVAIVVLAGRTLSVDASTGGVHVSGAPHTPADVATP